MKITGIYSSHRKNGNSATMAEKFIDEFEGAKADKFYLSDMIVNGCRGCGSCRKNETKTCVIDDDMGVIYKSINLSDIIVFASPLYWWSISSGLKAVVDRLYPYIGTGRLDNKKLVLLVSGFSEIPNSGYELIETTFNEICNYVNLEYFSLFISADDERLVGENNEALKNIVSLAKKVI